MAENRRTHVLLIEVSADDAATIEFYLSDSCRLSETLSLKIAPRLSTGCHLLRQETFDAVLLDLACPPESGIEAFQKVHSQSPDVPVIVLAGLRDENLAAQAVILGAQDYLIKGTFEGRQLKRTIDHAIEQKKLRIQLEALLVEDVDGKIVLDSQNMIRYANPAAQSFFGWKAKDFIGKPFGHPLPSQNLGDIRVTTPRFGERTVHMRVSDFKWESKDARLVTIRDVTEVQSIENLKKQLSESLRSAETRTQIVNSISHDLRNPLTVMKTAIYALKNGLAGPTTPEQAKFIDMAARNLERQIRMVDNILDFNRLQSGDVEMEMRRLELPPLISRVAQEFEKVYSSPRMEIDVPRDLPAVEGDPDLIAQVLKNLLDNAFHFANEKVTVKAASLDSGDVVLSVIDDGHGIPKEHLGQLFSQSPASHGWKPPKVAGLGLYISKVIIERHGGKIWVESVYGKGCRFNFSLPRFDQKSLGEIAPKASEGRRVIVHS